MPLFYPDIFAPNNPNVAQLDSEHLRGGRRVVTNLAALYALSTKADQLAQNVTIVRVLNSGNGLPKDYLLKDILNVGNANGWEPYGSSAFDLLDSSANFGTQASDSNVGTALAVKNYVLSLINDVGGVLQGNWDVTSTTNFPATRPGGAATVSGDYYVITGGPKSLGTPAIQVDNGDLLFAKQNAASATDSSHWFVVEANRVTSTETIEGIIRLATQLEVNNGTNVAAAVTPDKLQARIVALRASFAEVIAATAQDKFVTPQSLNALTFTQDFGNGTAQFFTITHNLNTTTPVVQIIRNSDFKVVQATVNLLTANSISITTGIVPTTNQFKVVIKK